MRELVDVTRTWNLKLLPLMSRQQALRLLASADSLLNTEINSMLTAVSSTKMTEDNMITLMLDVDNFWAQQGLFSDLYLQMLVSFDLCLQNMPCKPVCH